MSYRDEVGNLFNQGQFEAAAALAQTALAENPKDIRLADLLHRAKKKVRAPNLQFSNEWFPTWQHIWVDAFERLGWDRMKTHQVIEIGAFEGQCTSWLTDVLLGDNNSRVVVIDPFTGSMEHVAEQKTKGWLIRPLQQQPAASGPATTLSDKTPILLRRSTRIVLPKSTSGFHLCRRLTHG